MRKTQPDSASLLLSKHVVEGLPAPRGRITPWAVQPFLAISGFCLVRVPTERVLMKAAGEGGLAEGAGAGRAAPAQCQRKIGLLCNRELVLRNPFRELSSPDLLLRQEQSHTKAFSREAKIAPPSPCPAQPRALVLRPALLRRRGLGGTACVL